MEALKAGWLKTMRTTLWHFRHGGLTQVRSWQLRNNVPNTSHSSLNVVGNSRLRNRNESIPIVAFDSVKLPPRFVNRADIRAGVVLDDFSALAFGYEWDCVALTPESWRENVRSPLIDLLFIESAWAGNDGAWKYQLTGPTGPKPAFISLVEWCRARGIPTVFWNKEDPPHFNDFLAAAKLFDFVFTTDEAKIDDYRASLGHDNVGVLTFAAQPAIHNPVRPASGRHERDVAFAGMYFAHKYEQRREQMNILLGGALDASPRMTTGLEIFSRQLGGDTNYQFPPPWESRVVGSLTYTQMLTAYKAYKVFLNVNSVVDSPSMCARRIFEISASGAAVVTTPSVAVSRFFATDEVSVVDTRERAAYVTRLLVNSPEVNDRLVHKAQRRIWHEHTYSHRAEKVIAKVLPSKMRPIRRPSVSALVPTMRERQLEHVFRTIGSQRQVETELILLTHGFTPEPNRVRELASAYGVENYQLLTAAATVSLGECLNICVQASSGDVLAKMDDDDFYGANYLIDQVNAIGFSRADVVGKQAHYVYFTQRNATMLRFPHREHRYTDTVLGATVVAKREVFEMNPFADLSRGEDTDFLRRALKTGSILYSADRFNYYTVRTGQNHTWQVTDDQLISTGEVKFFGLPVEHVDI